MSKLIALFSISTSKLFGMWFAVVVLALGASEQVTAAPLKVLRTADRSAETSFDPQYESDAITGNYMHMVFEAPLEYDLLARPVKLKPLTLTALPEVSADGKTYTLRIQPGIYFTPHEVFKGQRRELVARDYAFAIKRMLDPGVRSRWAFLVEGKIVGGDAARDRARALAKSSKQSKGHFDYDAPIEGIRVLDKYTLQIELTTVDYTFVYSLALPAFSAVAREVVQRYGDEFGQHPVGTGPYVLKSWKRASKLVFEKNPDYREVYWDATPTDDPADIAMMKRMKGKRIPIVDRVETGLIEESQPRWLAFVNNELDYSYPVPDEYATSTLPGGKLAPTYVKRGMWTTPDEVAWVTYTAYNMNDKTIGGYTADKVALRRAIGYGYRIQDEIQVWRKNQAVRANSPLTPDVAGYNNAGNPINYDPARAKALLDLYGYIDRDGDGFREMPDGSALVLDHAMQPTLRERQLAEIWRRSMTAIGIRMVFETKAPLPELRKKAMASQLQVFSYGWIADYPDGENFLQLFTKASIGGVNYSQFNLPEFEARYAQIKQMQPGPERDKIYDEMVKLIFAYSPWLVGTYVRGTVILQPWVDGFKKHPFMHEPWKMIDIDVAMRERVGKGGVVVAGGGEKAK
jgi:oligopeptide transport system substrate-binding protein